MKQRICIITGTGCMLLAALLCAGCMCDCETTCTENGQTYTAEMVRMKRSECRELNDVGSDSCNYHCRD
ncbi:MAG: hypothetical protein GF418_08625 [Chitinivibrionales bacterium]|nr:hypothetical protein [Chitinivibrionales bacterium]MBD3395677.1 hypothetical protein [Chitinivibrionales bacterium]